jgi:hypothetical protein
MFHVEETKHGQFNRETNKLTSFLFNLQGQRKFPINIDSFFEHFKSSTVCGNNNHIKTSTAFPTKHLKQLAHYETELPVSFLLGQKKVCVLTNKIKI